MTLDPVISPAELTALADAPVLIDARPDARAYAAGHLAGAHHAQLERDLAAPVADPANGGRHPLPRLDAFAATLGRWGIAPGAHVVIYDDQNGANAAARLWWMLRAIGHDRVQVVDGGLAALRDAGLAITTEVPLPAGAPPYPATAMTGIADIDEVERARSAADRRIIDVRAAFRFRGESDPFDPNPGHIPGARNAPYADNLRGDGRFKSADELRAQFAAALDGTAPAQTILHCGSGVTACHTLLAFERAGLRGAKLYVGSWSEWGRRSDRAREPSEPRT